MSFYAGFLTGAMTAGAFLVGGAWWAWRRYGVRAFGRRG